MEAGEGGGEDAGGVDDLMITLQGTKPLAPWADSLPHEWRLCRLKSVASIRYGLGQPPAELSSGVAMIRATDVDAGTIRTDNFLRVDPAGLPPDRNPYLKAGEIIVVRSGAYTGDSAIVPSSLEGAVAGYDMVATVTRASSHFVAYSLLSKHVLEDQIFLLTLRAAQPHLNAEELGSVVLAMPPTLHEQQRIAAYLDASCAAIDAAVAAKRRQLETLDSLRKSAAHQVLSEGLRPGLPLRDSGIESIGVIPAHWDVKQIRYACEVNYGITLQLEKGQSAGDGVRILTVSNLTIDGNLDLEDEYYIDPAELTKADYLRRGDLLFNWRNGSQYHVGKTAFFDMEGEVAHVSFLLRIRCGRHMYPFFLRSYLGVLKDAGFFAGAKDKVNKTFNSTELKRLRVVIPPMDEQKEVCREIERRTKECNDMKAAVESQIATLTAYRKSLIHECVTGKRRVTDEDVRRARRADSIRSLEHRS
jgi:type I restriction enzyme S subunit